MKKFISMKNLLLLMLLATANFNVWAKTYNYHADVKGMVCAFCAYSVSKNVSKLPGVDADSVNVDLKGGSVTFRSKEKVEEKKLAELFGESGFTVSHLTVTTSAVVSKKLTKKASLELQIDIFKVDQLTSVIEAIGNIAASTPSRLVITAPLTQEDIILKPLLMGRQQVIKVRFIPTETNTIQLRLFDTL